MQTLKYLRIILLATIVLSCNKPTQQTRQQKAENAAKAYLMIHLNDPHSYEIVGFSKLDTSIFGFYDSPKSKTMSDSLSHITSIISNIRLDMLLRNLSYNEKKDKVLLHKFFRDSVEYQKKYDTAQKSFKSHQGGWTLRHTYRAKNGFGALGLHQIVFIFNMNCDTILDAVNNDR